jgi:hypothetical protein
MFKLKIGLVIASLEINEKTQNIQTVILSKKKNELVLPVVELQPDIDIKNQHKQYFKDYTGLDYDWVEHKILDLEQEDNTITMYYCSTIPIETKTNNGFFISSNYGMDKKIIHKAIRLI